MLDLTMQITADASQAKAELRSVEQGIQRVEGASNKTAPAISKVTDAVSGQNRELSKVEQAFIKAEAAVLKAERSSAKLGSTSVQTTQALSGLTGGTSDTASALLGMVGASELSVAALVGVSAAAGIALAGLAAVAKILYDSTEYYYLHAKGAEGLRHEVDHLGEAWIAFKLIIGGAVLDGEKAPLISFLRLSEGWLLRQAALVGGLIDLWKRYVDSLPGAGLIRAALEAASPSGTPPPVSPRWNGEGGRRRDFGDFGAQDPSLSWVDRFAADHAPASPTTTTRALTSAMREQATIAPDVAHALELVALAHTHQASALAFEASQFAASQKAAENYIRHLPMANLVGIPGTRDLSGVVPMVSAQASSYQGNLAGRTIGGTKSPGFFSGAFGGSSGLGSLIGSSALQSIMGGGNIASGIAGSIGSSLTSHLAKVLTGGAGIAIGGFAGGALNAILPGLGAMIGPLFGKLFSKLFGETQGHKDLMAGNKQIADMKTSLSAQYGSNAAAQNAGSLFGVDLKAAWNSQNLAGAEHFKALLSELAQKQAKFNDSLGGTIGKIKDLGGAIDPALLPYIERLKDAKVLTQENIDLIASMTKDAKPSFEQVAAAAERLGISTDHLGQSFQNARAQSQWQSVIDDLDTLARSGEDLNALFGSDEGLQKRISELVQQSIKFGTVIPENMRPWIEQLAKSGKLVDENGNKIKDLSGLTFGATLQTTLEKLNATLKDLIDALGVKLPDAIGKVPRSIDIDVTYKTHGRVPGETDDGTPNSGGDTGPTDEPTPPMHYGGLIMHRGGMVPKRLHAGGLSADEVPIIAQRGEYMMQRSAVNYYGKGMMRAINQRQFAPASGGQGGSMTLVLEQDGRTAARWIVPFIPGEVKRLGLFPR